MVVVLIGCLLARLAYLQISGFDHYATLSKNNRLRLQAVAPPRGLIFDRNGVALAENLPAYQLMLIPEKVDDIDQTLASLQELIDIPERNLQRFDRLLQNARSFEALPLMYNLDDHQVAKIAVLQHRYPGVFIKAQLSRHYPHGETAAHIIGYVGRIDERDLQSINNSNYAATHHIGKIGIEKFYEDRLHGEVGQERVEVNVAGRVLRVLEEDLPTVGQNLYLTIDIQLQKAAEEAMENYSGALVMMDTHNGDILAIVSKPSFDPNLFINGISHSDYAALRDDREQPLFNRALTGQYPPGSTIKPIIGLAGLRAKLESHYTSTFCRGYYKLPNDPHRYRDWKKTGHGKVNLAKAVSESCDVLFYDLALRMGIDRMSPALGEFGFGQKTGVDSTNESSGILPSRAWKLENKGAPWFAGETLITGIGQGYMLATPLQLASATATMAMRGQRVKPRLLHRVQDSASTVPETQTIEKIASEVAYKDTDWKYMHRAMVDVAHHPRGTAYRANLGSSYKIAAKTGTAQVFTVAQDKEYNEEELDRELHDHALYIAYAPANRPRIALSLIVEHGGSGGNVAAPIGRKVMDAYFARQKTSAATPSSTLIAGS